LREFVTTRYRGISPIYERSQAMIINPSAGFTRIAGFFGVLTD
jgi:hypothetical protein